MNKQEEKNCPRCNEAFTCKAGDISHCQCTEIRLDKDTRKFLDKTFYDCLCNKCLAAIAREVAVAKTHLFPAQKELMIEGLHYYKENGLIVFTPLYHMLRGYCCKSGCRHCVYGFKNNLRDITT